jgi:hypothetical protein
MISLLLELRLNLSIPERHFYADNVEYSALDLQARGHS